MSLGRWDDQLGWTDIPRGEPIVPDPVPVPAPAPVAAPAPAPVAATTATPAPSGRHGHHGWGHPGFLRRVVQGVGGFLGAPLGAIHGAFDGARQGFERGAQQAGQPWGGGGQGDQRGGMFAPGWAQQFRQNPHAQGGADARAAGTVAAGGGWGAQGAWGGPSGWGGGGYQRPGERPGRGGAQKQATPAPAATQPAQGIAAGEPGSNAQDEERE